MAKKKKRRLPIPPGLPKPPKELEPKLPELPFVRQFKGAMAFLFLLVVLRDD